jgi:hypothetical protein
MRSTGSGSTAGPALKLKIRMTLRSQNGKTRCIIIALRRDTRAATLKLPPLRTALLLALAIGHAAAAPPPGAEVQIALCEPLDSLVRKLALTPREPAYETWQFDDASLSLLDHGVRVRLRMKARDAELTVKLAIPDCDNVTVRHRQGKCEYDVYAGKPQAALSLTRILQPAAAQELVAGRRTLADALNEKQSSSLRDRIGPLPTDLRALGPIANDVYFDRQRDEIDVNTLPDGRRYAEISRKVPLADADAVQRELTARLVAAQVAICADQRSEAADKLRRLAKP